MRKLMDSELDLVSGGLDGYTHCPNGTTSGGGPGLYPDYATCNGPDGGRTGISHWVEKLNTIINRNR